MVRVLLLNTSFEPLNICSWQRAMVLLMKGKAEQIEHNCKLINSAIPLPSVIRLLNYVIVPYSNIPLNRKNILHRDFNTCQYCGKVCTTGLTIDHVIPKSRGGKHSWGNVVAACIYCNNKKSNRTPKEAGMKLIRMPEVPSNRLKFELTKHSGNNQQWEKYII